MDLVGCKQANRERKNSDCGNKLLPLSLKLVILGPQKGWEERMTHILFSSSHIWNESKVMHSFNGVSLSRRSHCLSRVLEFGLVKRRGQPT